MSNLISRQNAIDAAIEAVNEWDGGPNNLTRADMIADAINNAVPSAEPEIIHCKDCKWYCNVLYGGTQFECGECCRAFTEDVKPDDYCSRGEQE